MKKKSFILLLSVGTIFSFFIACEEEFPKDEIIGDWKIDKFHYINPDSIFTSHDIVNLDSLSFIDSTFDTIATRFGWYMLSLYENLSLYSEEFNGDSASGYWERLSQEDVRVWVNGKSQSWHKIDNNNYIHEEFFDNIKIKKVFWKRTN